jgi:hypothetical protein
MFSHRAPEWSFTELTAFSKLTPVPYKNAHIAKPVLVSNAGRYEMLFDPLQLDSNGILNIYVSISNDTKKLDFLDVYKKSDAVVVHSLYNTKGFVSAEILNEEAKADAKLTAYLQESINDRITGYMLDSYNMSVFAEKLTRREEVLLEKELNATFYASWKKLNDTYVANGKDDDSWVIGGEAYNASLKAINKTMETNRTAEKAKIPTDDYIPEMVKKLKNVNNTEFNNQTGMKSYSILNHYKILYNH